MLKVQFLAVVFLLIVFVREVDSRGRNPPCRPRACQVSSWSEWSSCPYHCGTGGKQERTRTRTVLESCRGSCPFALIQTRWCKTVNCQDLGKPTGKSHFCQPAYNGICYEIKTWEQMRNYNEKATLRSENDSKLNMFFFYWSPKKLVTNWLYCHVFVFLALNCGV